MIKFIIIITKLVVTTVIAILFSSCQLNGIIGSGKVTTENRAVTGDFESIEVEKGLDVVVEQSNQKSITVIADDNLQKHIKTIVTNGVLKITSDYSSYTNVSSKEIIVKMPNIKNITASSGSNVISKKILKSDNIAINSSSGATINVVIEVDKVTCESSSGSNMEVNGKALDLETAASSGSHIDAEKLMSNTIAASASSGSSIEVYPLVGLNAKASSGGIINYHNIPKNLKRESSSGGTISKQ